jgi:hypothetical protein
MDAENDERMCVVMCGSLVVESAVRQEDACLFGYLPKYARMMCMRGLAFPFCFPPTHLTCLRCCFAPYFIVPLLSSSAAAKQDQQQNNKAPKCYKRGKLIIPVTTD